MKYFISILTILFITSCALFTPNPAHFKRTQIETKYLTFSVWEKESIQPSKPIRIYIEGDGNPNPYHQIALYYAEQDPSNNVIYLARPCQWTNDKICETKPEIYKGQRFHPEMIREIEEVILLLINKYQAPTVELVGYDGGATIALNIAPKINTRKIITIAGILDTNAYARDNNQDLMLDAQNPYENRNLLSQIPQIHYVGEDDTITPQKVAERFVRDMFSPRSTVVKKVPGIGHTNWQGVKLDY